MMLGILSWNACLTGGIYYLFMLLLGTETWKLDVVLDCQESDDDDGCHGGKHD